MYCLSLFVLVHFYLFIRFLFCCITDVIDMVVSISYVERTKTKGTAKRKCYYVICSMYFPLRFSRYHIPPIYILRFVHVMILHRMRTLRLTLWGDFAAIEGAHLHRHLYYENILLASRVHVRTYEGIIVLKLIIPI